MLLRISAMLQLIVLMNPQTVQTPECINSVYTNKLDKEYVGLSTEPFFILSTWQSDRTVHCLNEEQPVISVDLDCCFFRLLLHARSNLLHYLGTCIQEPMLPSDAISLLFPCVSILNSANHSAIGVFRICLIHHGV